MAGSNRVKRNRESWRHSYGLNMRGTTADNGLFQWFALQRGIGSRYRDWNSRKMSSIQSSSEMIAVDDRVAYFTWERDYPIFRFPSNEFISPQPFYRYSPAAGTTTTSLTKKTGPNQNPKDWKNIASTDE